MGSGICERKMGSNRREDGELNYQERVAVIWIEKVKAMGSRTLDSITETGIAFEDFEAVESCKVPKVSYPF